MNNKQFILSLPLSLVEKAISKKLPCILCDKYTNKTCTSRRCKKFIYKFLNKEFKNEYEYAQLIDKEVSGNARYE